MSSSLLVLSGSPLLFYRDMINTIKYIYLFFVIIVSVSCSYSGGNSNNLEIKALSEDSIESCLRSYIYTNISYETVGHMYCDMDQNSILMISRIFKGLDQFEKGNIVEAWEILDHCMPKIESCRYASEICFVIGKALGERDLDTALILLKRSLQISRSESRKNRALEYSSLNEIIRLLASSVIDGGGDGDDFNIDLDLLTVKYAAEADSLLSDDSFCCYENNAATSIYRISTEALIWLGKDSIADIYMDRYLEQKRYYNNSEITEYYIEILNGIRAYRDKSYREAEELFKSAIDGIGKYDSYLNYSLELPYAYLGTIYYTIDDIENSILYMKNSIRSLQNSYYSSGDEEFKYISADQFQNSHHILNVIITYIRLQRCYSRALDLGDKSVTIEELSNLSSYVNSLIKSWFLTAADNETLLFATRLIKQSNEVLLEAIYRHSKDIDADIDRITSLAVEPGSFNLNYLIKLRNPKSNVEESRSFYKKMAKLSLEAISKGGEDDSLTFDEIRNRLELFRLKYQLLDRGQYSDLVDNRYEPCLIEPGDAIIKYFVSYHYLYIIYYTSNGKGVERVSLDNLNENITALRRGVKSGADFQQFSRYIYDQLIDPIVDHLDGVDQLTIMSDELISGVTFELLQNHAGDYLVENYSIKYQRFFKSEKLNKISSHNRSLLAVASGFENDLKREGLSSKLYIKGCKRSYLKLPPLPHSIDEVKTIESYFKDKDLNSTIITSAEATKTNFISNLSDHNIIHIATHGISNKPYGSGLFFSQSKEDNGFLALYELYQLKIDADLVTLSACKTAVGKVQMGEGVQALPRGFICAGVKNIIATLWNINDDEASLMMVLFYKHLLNNDISYARALQLAKIDMIKRGTLPIDWGGFVLVSK